VATQLLTAAAIGVPASAQPFDVDAILSAPFPSEIVAAQASARVAFVLNDKGVRNIWVASSPDYEARRVTSYTEDDGINLRGLRFTPDAAHLLYSRGGAPNRAGELPNPRSFPGGGAAGIWVVAVDADSAGTPPRRIDRGAGASIHPGGDLVAYVKKGEIWVAPLHGDGEARVLLKARGGISSLTWAPDGRRLAFRSNRQTHSFIGVWEGEVPEFGVGQQEATAEDKEMGADEAAGSIRWIDPGVDRDLEPVWSPEGNHIAFLRLPTLDLNRFVFEPERDGEPWSIRVADLDAGTAREVWRADIGAGSVFRGVVARRQLLWADSDRLVFPWEGDGWTHLYSVPADGGEALLLTPGAFEVEHVALGPERRALYYAANQDDPHRRHIWRVPVAGGPPTQVTSGVGIEWSPAPTSDGQTVAILRSDAKQPARAAIVRSREAPVDLAPRTMPADFPVEHMVEPVAVTVTATDGMQIPAQLFLPKDLKPGDKRPAAIFLHGGSRRQMLLGWHYSGYYHNAYGMSQYLANRGFIALALNFRSGIGYGMEFREALDYGATGASEVQDVIGAGLYLKARPDVDSERIGLWGGSYGGYLTAHGLAQASDLFAAGVDIHGVHDWNWSIQNFVPRYDPKDYPEEASLAWESSPLAYVDGWTSPVLLIHGDDDRNVNFKQTTRLVKELRERQVEVELLVFPDEVHGFLLHESWLGAYRATAEFLERRLGGDQGFTTRGR
jgi:dipeptidyl aminopeptidase/acylaminoacyl peptidase